uniref:Uncharacterized protein n=1 Tax=Anopheles merus TaxID=30066 RepID=A0A182VFY7_ANOME
MAAKTLISDSGSVPVPILVVADRCAAIVPLVGVRLPPHLSPSRSKPDRICPMVACVIDDGKISDGSSGTDTPRRISLEVFISSFASWRSSGVTALTAFTSRRKSSFSSAQAATLTSLLSRACSSRCFNSRSRPISSVSVSSFVCWAFRSSSRSRLVRGTAGCISVMNANEKSDK